MQTLTGIDTHGSPDGDYALSVVVPCYKTEPYLERCLDSLVNQTLDSMEIVCVNDGSPDGCREIIERYVSQYPGKVKLVDQENAGIWRARMNGIRHARGGYIGFLDSDDFVAPDYAASLVAAAKALDADIVVAGYDRLDGDSGDLLAREMCDLRSAFDIVDDPGRVIEINTAPWNKIFRASLLKGMHDMKSPPPIFEDVTFHLLVYLMLGGGGRIAFVPRPLVCYGVHGGSNITSVNGMHAEGVYRSFLEVRHQYHMAQPGDAMIEVLDAMAFVHLGVSLMSRFDGSPGLHPGVACKRCVRYLDAHFPTWRHSRYFTRSYGTSRGDAYLKMRIAHKAFRLGVMPAFLGTYRQVINISKKEIKW